MKNVIICLLALSLMLAAQATFSNNYLGIGIATPTHPFHIRADNPGTNPLEQAVIDNPNTTSGTAQSMLALCGWDGSGDLCHGWFTRTSHSFNYAPFPDTIWLESDDAGGVIIASDHPTLGGVRILTGCYTGFNCVRMFTSSAGLTSFLGTDGPTQGASIEQTANNATAQRSYMAMNFKSPSGLIGQFLSTASNYNSVGAINLPALSMALLAYLGNLTIGAAGNVNITAGGYDAAHTQVVITPTAVQLKSLAGTGVRPVCADASGNLQPCP